MLILMIYFVVGDVDFPHVLESSILLKLIHNLRVLVDVYLEVATFALNRNPSHDVV